MKYRLDMHVHSELSSDGVMTLREIEDEARKKGLSGVCVCDHNELIGETAPSEDVLVIRGTEFSTEYGHLLGMFLTEPIEKKPFAELVSSIHAQGGIAVLAHPFEHNTDEARLEPIASLLDGIEVKNGRADRKILNANALAKKYAEKKKLPAFAGSDAHVRRELGNCFVELELDSLCAENVKKALLSGKAAIYGRDGRHIDVAKSQYVRRKKQGAGLGSYAKWALFAAKCCVEDIFS